MSYPLRLQCPHCEHRVVVRSSRPITPTYRHLNAECTNEACGHSYAVSEERFFTPLYSIKPSRRPNPAVALAMTESCRRLLRKPANDTGGPEVPLPRAANDDSALDEAMGGS